MRQLKFRIWDTLAKHYIYPEDKLDAAHYWITLDGKVQNMQNGAGSPELVIQEWTGTQDLQGKDIYEGDYLSPCGWGGFEYIEVKWVSELNRSDWTGWNVGYTEEMSKKTVIGNIFQNPELLQN